MDTKVLDILINSSENSPQNFKETVYWEKYKKTLIDHVKNLDINELRSGKYSQFSSFGFNEFFPKRKFVYRLKATIKLFWRYLFLNKAYPVNVPYSITSKDMAYRYCVLNGKLTNSKDISLIETSKFGNPQDVFEIKGKTYTMSFLNYYIRYCFVQKYIPY